MFLLFNLTRITQKKCLHLLHFLAFCLYSRGTAEEKQERGERVRGGMQQSAEALRHHKVLKERFVRCQVFPMLSNAAVYHPPTHWDMTSRETQSVSI